MPDVPKGDSRQPGHCAAQPHRKVPMRPTARTATGSSRGGSAREPPAHVRRSGRVTGGAGQFSLGLKSPEHRRLARRAERRSYARDRLNTAADQGLWRSLCSNRVVGDGNVQHVRRGSHA